MNKKSNITGRINEIIDHYKITANELAARVGGSRTKVYNAVNGKANPGFETLESILGSFPDVSAEWLMRGNGPMFASEIVSKEIADQLRNENTTVKTLLREEMLRSAKTSFKMGASNDPQVDREWASELLDKSRAKNIRAANLMGLRSFMRNPSNQ